MKKLIFIFFNLYMLLLPIHSDVCAACIRNIDIVRLNVFDRQLENSGNFIYRLANKFHVVTMERIIRQELLFKQGDIFKEEVLEESLRNIRALPFIGDAKADIIHVDNDLLDIKIITEDFWTTTIGLSGEGGGGRYVFTAFADEKNIAGSGIGIETTVQFTSDEDNGFMIHLLDRRLFGSRVMADLWFQDLNYAEGLSVTLLRPFYSLKTRWRYGVSLSFQDTEQRLFYNGSEIYRYKADYENFTFSAKRAFGIFKRLETGILYNYTSENYAPLSGYPYSTIIPDDETFCGPGIEIGISTRKYFTAVYLDEFGTVEDLKEHAYFRNSVVWSNSAFNSNLEGAFINVGAGFFIRPSENIYAGFKNSYTTYYIESRQERITNVMNSILYYKPGTYHLLAGRFLSVFGWRQRDNYQVVLGGSNGLRGYPDRYFEGSKLALMNLEYRVFTPVEILTVNLGGAAFFDAGYVWDDNKSIDFKDMNRDVGLGLRFGLTKSSTARIVSFDVARALDQDNWYISFRTGNLFGLASFQ